MKVKGLSRHNSWKETFLVCFDYESVGFDKNRSKHGNDPHIMKKLREKHAKKDTKKEIYGSKKKGSNTSGSKALAKRRRVIEVTSRDELPKYLHKKLWSVLDIISIVDSVIKFTAGCEFCSERASFTLRKTEETRMELTAEAEVYMPVCRKHYVSEQVVKEVAKSALEF
ncbi:Kinase superfamily protein [Capsicum annuum]|nr:Kinase superfamily protein [Capsicum annuum]